MSQKPLHPFFSLSFFLLLSYPFVSHGQGTGKSTENPSVRSVSGYRPSIDPALRRKASTPVMSAHKPMVSASRQASVLALPSALSAVPPKRPDPLDHIPKPLKSFYLAIADSTKPHQYDGSLPKAAHGLFALYQKHYSGFFPNVSDFEAAALAHEAEENRKKGIQPDAEPESKMASESSPTPFIQLLRKEFGPGDGSPLEETKQKLLTIVMGLQSYRDYGFDMLLSKENGRSIVHNLYVMAFGSLSSQLGGRDLDLYHSSHSEVFGARAASAAASNSFQDFEPPVSGRDNPFQTEDLGLPSDLRRMTLSESTPPSLLNGGSECSMTSPSEPVPDSGRSMLPSFGATDLTPSLLNTDQKPLDPIEDSAPHSAAALSASNSFQDFEPPVSGGGNPFQTEGLGLPSDLRRMTLSESTPPSLLNGGSECSMTSPSEPVPDSGRSMLPSFGATDLTPSLLNTDQKPLDPIEDSAPHSAAALSAPSQPFEKTDWIRRLSDASQIDQSFFGQLFALCEEDRTRVRSLISLLRQENPLPLDFLFQLVALTPEQQAFLEAQDPSLFELHRDVVT